MAEFLRSARAALRQPMLWWVVVFAVAAVSTALRVLRQPTDYAIYLQAARELAAGGVDLYRPQAEHGAYPYPHFFALLLSWVDAVLPEVVQRVLFALGQGVAMVWIVRDLRALGGMLAPVRPQHWALFALLFVRCFSANFTNGQLSLWVAALLTRGIRRLVEGRAVHAGALIGCSAALKLTPLLFLVALPFMRRTRAAVVAAAVLFGCTALFPWPFLGTAEHVRHLRDFSHAMLLPLADRSAGSEEIWQGASASIAGTLHDVLQDHPPPPGQRSFCYVDLDAATLARVQWGWSALLATALAWGFWQWRRQDVTRRLLGQSALLTLAMALFSPLTRTYHLSSIAWAGFGFAVSGPGRGARRLVFFATCAALAMATTLRQRALLGRDLWSLFDHLGLLHLGLVGMVVVWALLGRVPAPERKLESP